MSDNIAMMEARIKSLVDQYNVLANNKPRQDQDVERVRRSYENSAKAVKNKEAKLLHN
jgi:hypothetical protein